MYKVLTSLFHTSSLILKKPSLSEKMKRPSMILNYNKCIFPPQQLHEERRPAECIFVRRNIKYSAKKLWHFASVIRGLSIDAAYKHLGFINYYGARIITLVLKEAQEEAVKNHHVEFKSNMWIAESIPYQGFAIKGVRKHARARRAIIKYKFCHYGVRLIEGPPPETYYPKDYTSLELIERSIEEIRRKKIQQGL